MEKTASEIFTLLSRELRHLAELTSALQDQLSPRGYEDLDIEAFQSLDSLNQTLDCLARYVAHVGAIAPCQCSVPIEDAAEGVCLAALADRLRGGPRAPSKLDPTEVELF